MNCCENAILCTKGTSVDATVKFDEDISSYTSALFVVRKNADTEPEITKSFNDLSNNTVKIALTPAETNVLVVTKNPETYIWGLDLIASTGRISVFPKSGEFAPQFVVFKHIAEE